MTAFILFSISVLAYNALYWAHCKRTGQRTAAAGAVLLCAAAEALAIFLIR